MKKGLQFVWSRGITLLIILFILSYLSVSLLYLFGEPGTFDEYTMLHGDRASYARLSDNKKGVHVAQSVINHLETELDLLLGYSVNDLKVSPTYWLDNRRNRQAGVIFGVREVAAFFSEVFSKKGKNDPEDKQLQTARNKNFTNSEEWGFAFVYSEKYLQAGIKNYKTYQKALEDGDPKTQYNVESKDLFAAFEFVTGPKLIDVVTGKLSISDSEISHFQVDDDIYYAQGVMLIIRDFIRTLDIMYPEIREKAGDNNLDQALKLLDEAAAFNPLYTSDSFGHRAEMYKICSQVERRLEDVRESLRR